MSSTPVKQTAVSAAAVTDSPGTWLHPRLAEITRRREATTFSEKNVRRIAYNVVALFTLYTVRLVAGIKIDGQIFPKSIRVYIGWLWFILQLVPFIQIGLACLPLIRPKDDLTDIPLTANQRDLLGLDPVAIPPTPPALISTPPRYSRTPSLAGSVGSRAASLPGSPLSGRGSPVLSGSQFSPIGSPLLQRTLGGQGRRSSFGSSTNPFATSFGASTSSSIFGDPASPSPSGNKRTSVGLNNKWLYEKGRRSSGSSWVH